MTKRKCAYCGKYNYDDTKQRLEEGRKEGAIVFGNKVIELVQSMPNADDRLPNNLLIFDGGSVSKFKLIDKIKELLGGETK